MAGCLGGVTCRPEDDSHDEVSDSWLLTDPGLGGGREGGGPCRPGSDSLREVRDSWVAIELVRGGGRGWAGHPRETGEGDGFKEDLAGSVAPMRGAVPGTEPFETQRPRSPGRVN